MINKIFLVFIVIIAACTPQPKQDGSIDFPPTSEAPEWSKNATIYEVNIRQFTPEGTINAFSKHLPALKELGVDILWLMPIYPISEKFRKADAKTFVEEVPQDERSKYLGSYYAIKDYKAVNPDLGTGEDLRSLVQRSHALGMKVILDIAANHTGWDHEWITTHPEYYRRVQKGATPWNKEWMAAHPEFYNFLQEHQLTYPIEQGETDWWDTAELNYANEDLRREMISILKYWVREFNIDGYRCDVAMQVPTDFWEQARQQLDTVKDVFMLAEAEQPDQLVYAFDMNYGWELHHIMNQLAKGEDNVGHLREYLARNDSVYNKEAYRMYFITNHDENTWNGTINERMGEAQESMAVLMTTLPGMPLLYSGQETGLNKRLRFFEKDTIEWSDSPYRSFYSRLFEQKHKNQALWNGKYGADLVEMATDQPDKIFAFSRVKNGDRLVTVVNLSNEEVNFSLKQPLRVTGMHDLFGTNGTTRLKEKTITMKPWEYIVLTNKP